MGIFKTRKFDPVNRVKDRFENAIPYNLDEILLSRGISFLRDKYGYSINLSGGDAITKFNTWLAEHDPKWKKRKRKVDRRSTEDILDDQIICIDIDINTILLVTVGKILEKYNYRRNFFYSNSRDDKDSITQSVTNVYIFGKKAKKYYNEINEVINHVSDNLVIYNISPSQYSSDKESLQSIVSDLNCRDINTLFYSDNTKQVVTDHIDQFFKNKPIYDKRSINFKTGILLYGEPGTGKSSLINALAVKYGLNIISIDINNFDKLDLALLTSCINGDDLTYIVAIEDIDLVFNLARQNVATESSDIDDEDEEDEDELVTKSDNTNNAEVANAVTTDKKDNAVIHKLLQFLDSNSSPSNVIFIATTNCVEKLDKAILREGRFDKKVHIGPITKDEARLMCKSFECTDEQTEEILAKIKGNMVNQSKLQAMILGSLKENLMGGNEDEEVIIDNPEDTQE